MADVQPLRTLRYDPDVAGPLEDLIAPPYDVIDDELRARAGRAERPQRRRDRPPDELRGRGADPRRVAPATECSSRRTSPQSGRSGRTTRRRTAAPATRSGVLRARARRGLRRGSDPAARAHPPGPEGGPAQTHARDAREPLPHLQPLPRSRRRGPETLGQATDGEPFAEATDDEGTRNTPLASGRPRADRRAPGRARRRRAADRRRPPPLRDRARVRRRGRRRGRAPLRADVPGGARRSGPARSSPPTGCSPA